MAENTPNQASAGAQTTGHVWDGDLQEYNNPLPMWWIWGLYVTIAFALIYWVIYPSWPIGKGFLPGLNTLTYTNSEGQEETWHWNTRAKLMREMQDSLAAQKPYYDKLMAMPYAAIVKDPELSSFVISAGKTAFADNCAACHQSGGGGKLGFFPNLTDDDWLYGGTFDKIHETISRGRHGYMPPFAEALSAEQIDALAHYVLSLSGFNMDAAKAAKGNALFHSHTAACFYCHGDDARGRQDIGSANLADKVWLWADVPGAGDDAGRLAAVRQVIRGGLNRGVMPAWEGRLKPEQIKLLTIYVHELGGGR
ncbi:MAG TPA: cytochrome-c oxidase, cbb3-type subunit III [Thiobacillaceae bacterium]|nr:cytochrome-c oxidase, cbb3-type subunit III [Thiobacillaceae bacterium]HNU64813.1 cytochrome-c oxidase, cbb3-type subunit III [Thiobacillaceae bacterium]